MQQALRPYWPKNKNTVGFLSSLFLNLRTAAQACSLAWSFQQYMFVYKWVQFVVCTAKEKSFNFPSHYEQLCEMQLFRPIPSVQGSYFSRKRSTIESGNQQVRLN